MAVLVRVFVDLRQAGDFWKERTEVEKMLVSHWPVDRSVGLIKLFFINDWCGRSQPAEDSAIPGQTS